LRGLNAKGGKSKRYKNPGRQEGGGQEVPDQEKRTDKTFLFSTEKEATGTKGPGGEKNPGRRKLTKLKGCGYKGQRGKRDSQEPGGANFALRTVKN